MVASAVSPMQQASFLFYRLTVSRWAMSPDFASACGSPLSENDHHATQTTAGTLFQPICAGHTFD
jgi:hypothetical protein